MTSARQPHAAAPQTSSRNVIVPRSLALATAAIAIVAAIAATVAFSVSEIPMATLRAKYVAPTSRFVTLKDGAVIHVREDGPQNAPVILMVPGVQSPLHVWNGWMAALRDEYHVVAVDLPGQGLSDSWPRNDYSIPALDSFITEVTNALGISRFTFAGAFNVWRDGLALRAGASRACRGTDPCQRGRVCGRRGRPNLAVSHPGFANCGPLRPTVHDAAPCAQDAASLLRQSRHGVRRACYSLLRDDQRRWASCIARPALELSHEL